MLLGRGWRQPLRVALTIGCLLLVANFARAQDSTDPHKVEGISGKNDGDHKAFWPLDGSDIATIVLASLGLIVAAGGKYLFGEYAPCVDVQSSRKRTISSATLACSPSLPTYICHV